MLSIEEYVALSGQSPPENYQTLLSAAQELLHAHTLQQFRGQQLPCTAQMLFKRALSLQIQYMDRQGGLSGWTDAAIASGVTLGRFSMQHSSAHEPTGLISPAAAALLPALTSYARSGLEGDIS